MSGLIFVTTDGSAKAVVKENRRASGVEPAQSDASEKQMQKQQKQVLNEDLALAPVVGVPPPPPSDWALIKFPVETDRTSQMLFHRYFPCNPIRDPLLPYKLFGIKIDVHTDNMWLASPLIQDELFYRAVDMMVSSSYDLICGYGLTNRTRRKLADLLPKLNQRLSLPDAHLQSTTLYVVGILVSAATLFADHASASLHAKGISQLFQLRRSAKTDPTDLMVSMALDRWIPIHSLSAHEAPRFPEEVTLMYTEQAMVRPDCVPDHRLALVFYTLQCTTILLNTHDLGAPQVNGARLHDSMGFVQSELLRLKDQLADQLSECIRLSLMTFLATTFRVPGQYEHPCCGSLAEPLLSACVANKEGISRLPKAMQTWLLLVGAMAAGAVSNERVRLGWRSLFSAKQEPWEVMRLEVKRVMWIDAIQDVLGRRALEFSAPRGPP
ncbi:hypothetical protein NLU13_3135 [Sarocladium strictum]|uniref:Uncharacterized protein n=1 Tax=Sarocladium strictum TaxID=5046 RepID=A0AA39GLF6_SARSR|nr:hypothetical protein NLU13_3135 [Sarocladium strictum]